MPSTEHTAQTENFRDKAHFCAIKHDDSTDLAPALNTYAENWDRGQRQKWLDPTNTLTDFISEFGTDWRDKTRANLFN